MSERSIVLSGDGDCHFCGSITRLACIGWSPPICRPCATSIANAFPKGTMNHGGASSTAKGYPGAYVAPVFKRTIKVKRGHSFSWALARMKEGKRVRAGRWDKRCSLRLGDEFFYTFVGCDGQSRKYELLSYDAADTWELAE